MGSNFFKVKNGLNLGSASADPANPQNGDEYYNTTTKTIRAYVNGLWSDINNVTPAIKNYLTGYNGNPGNGNFDAGVTTGWSLFNTTLTSLVPTGTITAGAASITTFAATNSGQLSGKYSLSTASTGNLTAGQGFISDAFTIDKADQASVISITARYSVVSGAANMNFSGTSANTFQLYVYDVTNSAWVQTAGTYSMIQNSGVGKISGTFQTASNASQYRVAIIVINASTGATSMLWDDFSFGTTISASGAAISDWQAYTPTITGFGTVTGVNFKSRRVGDTLEVLGYFNAGTTTATQAQITLGYSGGNANVSVDINKTPTGSLLGVFAQNVSNAIYLAAAAISPNTSASYVNLGFQNTSTQSLISVFANGNAFNSSVAMSIEFKVPIVGWSSNTVMSNDTDTRVVAFATQQVTPTGGLSTGSTSIIFPKNATLGADTHGAYNATTGQYMVPVAGLYYIDAIFSYSFTSANGGNIGVTYTKNGVAIGGFNSQVVVGSVTFGESIGVLVPCVAGDVLGVLGFQNNIATWSSGASSLAIFRLSGPATIAASETVAVQAYNVSGQSIANNTSTTVTGWTVNKQTHGSFNGTTGVFTAPISGWYMFNGEITYSGPTGVTGTTFSNFSFINSGTQTFADFGGKGASTTGLIQSMTGAALRYMLAGDTASIVVSQSAGSSQALASSGSNVNRFEVIKVGN